MGVNQQIARRLAGIRTMLMGMHESGSAMSTSSRGSERAAFVERFLCEVLTPQFRFGEGDAVDSAGNQSGQLDVVVEYPWFPSLPVGSNRPRLYLAEGIAAVIEVKSDVCKQWNEVQRTSSQLKKLRRQHESAIFGGGLTPPKQIPLFAVGYTGWRTMDAIEQRLDEGGVEGILVIDAGLFASVPLFLDIRVSEEWCLWGLITCLHQATNVLSSVTSDVLRRYAFPDEEPGAAP
jgi:hypothetical protein